MSDAIIILGTFALVLVCLGVLLYDMVYGEGYAPGSRESLWAVVGWYLLASLLGSVVIVAVLILTLGT